MKSIKNTLIQQIDQQITMYEEVLKRGYYQFEKVRTEEKGILNSLSVLFEKAKSATNNQQVVEVNKELQTLKLIMTKESQVKIAEKIQLFLKN